MANVKVAVRVRPLSKRERTEGRRIIVEVEDKVAKVRNLKVNNKYESLWDTKEKVVAFGFDYCYWSVDIEDPKHASQEVIFQDLGTSVLSGAFKGYNICLFAYGQTGSGKTYTMIGTPASVGLTPRICEGLFSRKGDYSKQAASCRVEVSFLEIYNERVRDLLSQSDHKKPYALRVREHPETGPYVQGLSWHVVTDYKQVVGLLEEGIANRITAATYVHDASSRSHAIFTIQYTQAILDDNLPSEIASKINLVDLAGSERADPRYCKDRMTEGANINKSLVTLGIVISTLAQNSQMFSSCQSINSLTSELDSSYLGSHGGVSANSQRRQAYIPYRDSILTWLLKDSLGGNSKTIMIATISPASSCYNETMSTLRYASNAKNIINKPRVNEDANVKLIRELREEIDRLKAMLMSFELRNCSPSWSDDKDGNLTELVLQNELKIEQLTKDWTDRWINRKAIMEEYSVDINKKKAGVVIDSSLPHLMAMDDDILSTGVVLYHLREGATKIGRGDSNREQDIVLQGQWIERDHCVIDNQHGIVTLRPLQGAQCIVNGHKVTDSFRLSQGALVVLGRDHKFRFNHPAEAAILRQRRSISEISSAASCDSLVWLDLDGEFAPSPFVYGLNPTVTEDPDSAVHSEFQHSSEKREQINAVHEECQPELKKQEVLCSRKIQEQQLYVEELRQQILDGQIKDEQELEHDQAIINQQIQENEHWLTHEKKRLAGQQQQRESAVQTEAKSYAEAEVQNVLDPDICPSLTEQNKKELVQLELLRKYSLKKAERKLRCKKVKLHLERIVKKQKLLEAKKNLDVLEATCWLTEDNGDHSPSPSPDTILASWDCKYPRAALLSDPGPWLHRRNSSLTLQLPYAPSSSFFQKRIVPSEFSTSAHTCRYSKTKPRRKYLSVEHLPRRAKEPYRRVKSHDEKNDFFPIQRQLTEKQKSYLWGKGVDNNSSYTEVIYHICKNKKKMDKANRQRQTRPKAQISKSCSDHLKKTSEPEKGKQMTKAKTLGDSCQEKSEVQQVSRKTKTDKRIKQQGPLPGSSVKELKKSAVYEEPVIQHLRQTAKNLKIDPKDKQQHEPLKAATSARNLNKINTRTPLCRSQKRWHSAGSPDPLRSWKDDEAIEFSDTDSSYSMDSLSCVYATVLSEQQLQEEPAGTEDIINLEDDSESDDSQMSQDSLTEKVMQTESQDKKPFSQVHQELMKSCKDMNEQPLSPLTAASALSNNFTERSFSLDSLGDADEMLGENLAEEYKLESFDEVPAEVYWRLQNPRSETMKSKEQHSPEICSEIIPSDDLNLNTNSFYLDASPKSVCNSISDPSVKEMKISFSEQGRSLNQRSHTAAENLPVLSDAWLSYELKRGKSSPIIAMPSSPDHSESQVALVYPNACNKSNCWMKKDDLRQSAAELSFVSYYQQPHQVFHEPNKIEMLFSSPVPSVPLPETRKTTLEVKAPETTVLFSAAATSVSFGNNVPTFPTKQGDCDVTSPPTSTYQQPDKLPESGSTDEWVQTTKSLKETSGRDHLSHLSEKEVLSVSSVYPAIPSNQSLKNNSLISIPDVHSLQNGANQENANFGDYIFRMIEKEEMDCDTDHNARDSKVIYSNPGDILTPLSSSGSLDFISICTTQEKYQSHEHLVSKVGTSLFCDEHFYFSDVSSKDPFTYIEEEQYSVDFDMGQKMRCQQVSVEDIAVVIESSSQNKLYQPKTTSFYHNDQLAVPIQTTDTGRISMQENRDVLTESALEAPSFREMEENKLQEREQNSENHLEFQTTALKSHSHSSLKLDYSGNHSEEEINIVSFTSQDKPLSTCMDLVTDKLIGSLKHKKEKNAELSVIASCETGDKFALQSNPNAFYHDTSRMGKFDRSVQGGTVVNDVCENRTCCKENSLRESCYSSSDSGTLNIGVEKHTKHNQVDDSLMCDSAFHSGKIKDQHLSLPATSEKKEALVLCTVLQENNCPKMELQTDQVRNYNKENFQKALISGNDCVVSATGLQEQNPHVNKEFESLKERVVPGAIITPELNKGEHNSKTISSEELTKLINSVKKLESGILEMKSGQSKSVYNYVRVEPKSEAAERERHSESYSVVQDSCSDHEKHCRKELQTVTHEETEKENVELIDVSNELCATKTAMGSDRIIQTNSASQYKTHANRKENCPADLEETYESIVPAECFSSLVQIQNTAAVLHKCGEPSQTDPTIVDVPSSEPTGITILPEDREENALNINVKEKPFSNENKSCYKTESLAIPPKTVIQEKITNVNVICSQAGNAEEMQCLPEPHTDENIVLLQENPFHDLMQCDSHSNKTNTDDLEIPEAYFTASKLEDQDDMSQLPEVCLDFDKAWEERSSASLWNHTDVVNCNDNSLDGYYGDVTRVCGIFNEEYKQIGSVENMNGSKCNSVNSISEHCVVNFVQNELNVYQCNPVHCVPKEKKDLNLQITPVQSIMADWLTPSTNSQNMSIFKTEEVVRNVKDNHTSPDLNVLQNHAEVIPENTCSYCFSKNEAPLSKELDDKEWVPPIFSKNNAEIVDESIPFNEKNQPESISQDCEIAPMAVKDFPHPSVYGIDRSSKKSKQGDLAVASNLEMSPHGSTSDGAVVQYYETQMDCVVQAGTLGNFSKSEINESLSDVVMQNQYIPFPHTLPGKDGEMKRDVLLVDKTCSYTTAELMPSDDDTPSKLSIPQCQGLLPDGTQSQAIPVRTLLCSARTSDEMGSLVSRGQYGTRDEDKSSTSASFDSENSPLFPFSVFKGNVEELIQSSPELPSQEYFNSQKELNLLAHYDLRKKCLGTNGTETEYKANSGLLTGELGCQTKGTFDSEATSGDGENLISHSHQDLWSNPHYGEEDNTELNTNSYISKYSATLLNSSAEQFSSLEQICSDESIEFPLPSLEDFSACTVCKNVGTLECPKSSEGFISSECRQYTDTQKGAVAPHLLSAFQVQESQVLCHQTYADVLCSTSETSHSLSVSPSEIERQPATPSCPALATRQMQDSQNAANVMADLPLCSSEATAISLATRNGGLPESDPTSIDGNGIHTLKSPKLQHEAGFCQDPKNKTPLQIRSLEDIDKSSFPTSNSSADLQGDQSTPRLNKKVDMVNSPTTKSSNVHALACKGMKSERELLKLELLNNSTSSKYVPENIDLSSLEPPKQKTLRNEKQLLSSQSTDSSKGHRQHPGFQSHSLSAPAIAVMSAFECTTETPSKVDFSDRSVSKSLQDLYMSVEPPSPTEDELHRTERFSKLNRDSVVPVKYKPRFPKKSIQALKSVNDKNSCRECAEGSHSLDPSPVHYPIPVAHTSDNPVDTETGKHSNDVTSGHGHSINTDEELRYQTEATEGQLQDNKDAMHFNSSDINPYIHPWQQDEHCKIGWKQYVFGSASDVSNNPPPLSLDNQTVIRCSSVDNGLNSQNSPFHSHLSSYANARILSSTISSADDLQKWDIAKEGFESTHSDENGKHYASVSHDELEMTPENNICSSENHPQPSGNTSLQGQVDEIVLFYNSKLDVSSNKPKELLTCDQETQTEAPAKHKRQKRHRRSYTDISTRKPEAIGNSFQQPSSWSSVQNLSVHLSQLLLNTSELLGNFSLQTVKDNERSDQKAIDEERSRASMSDSCTQTMEERGIQTDISGYIQSENKERQVKAKMEVEPIKSQEVNVIVKVIHSDTEALTKETISESKRLMLQSVPDLRNHNTISPDDLLSPQTNFCKDSSSSLEVQKIPLNAPSHTHSSPKVSPAALSSFGSRHDESSCTIVSSPASSVSLSPACSLQDQIPVGKPSISETREIYCKNSLFVDRASSPILTLSASPVRQHLTSNKSSCSFKGSLRHQKDTANSLLHFRKKRSASWFDLGSQEPHVDTSSQTEMDSDSTTSKESREGCKISGNILDKPTTKAFSGIDASEQKHGFTIDTHTAIHTKRLYHSSSTLELSSHGEYLVDDHRETVPVERSFYQIRATRRGRNLSGGINYEFPLGNPQSSPTTKCFRTSLNEHHSSLPLKSDYSPECLLDSFSPQGPFPASEMSDMQNDDSNSECNTEILLNGNSSLVKTHRLRSYSLRDLPMHNKFSNWCGVKVNPRSSLTNLTRSAGDIQSQTERTLSNPRAVGSDERSLLSERRAREIERLRRERAQVMSGIHLDTTQHPLTLELTEAKLNYGIGETDAQLRILQSGGGEDLPSAPVKQQLYERHRKSIEILRKQREERLQCFRRSRSLSPQKHLSLLQAVDTNQRDLDLPSRRREYLQQLRRDVVENTRVQETKKRLQHPSEIEVLLQDYQRAREEAKTEIARARDKLRERAEQEKRRIREQILSQLQNEESKLKTLVSTSTICTDSTLSLSSGPTSGYNSSNTTTYTATLLGKQGGQTSRDDAELSRGDARGRSAISNHQLYVLEQLQNGSTSESFPMTSSPMQRSSIQSPFSSSRRFSHSLTVSPSTFSTSPVKGYEDLCKHILANATAEVMAVCSNDLRNLYNGQAAAGWKYQCMEKDVLVYYKAFSSSATKHGFLGAGMINKPLPTILCMLKDPSKRHLYDKTITTAQVHKKIASNIDLVYVVSDISVCYQKQPRDFCCISVEAKEKNASILAIQSVYEESMPRPCKEMVRGEILTSAWILEPATVSGTHITKVVYMVQVDLGAPAIPVRLLSSVAKRQPLVIARLAHFLSS